ncbi:hypothetical protein TNCV_5094251 [Trichonephila clavipes]|nr:hypothetical protein TNCV_5094251 [Trichonephila clavipes]
MVCYANLSPCDVPLPPFKVFPNDPGTPCILLLVPCLNKEADPSSHGPELMTSVIIESGARNLMPMKTRRAEELIYVISVEVQAPPIEPRADIRNMAQCRDVERTVLLLGGREQSHTSAFGAAIIGNTPGTKFLKGPSRDYPFLPEPLQLSLPWVTRTFIIFHIAPSPEKTTNTIQTHVHFAMSSLEQSANIKISVLLEKSPEALEMLKKAYGNDSSAKGSLPVSISENEIEGTSFSGLR